MAKAPEQPNVHVRKPGDPNTPTVRTNDPISNEAERKMFEDEQRREDEESQRQMKEQEEQAKREQEEADQRRSLLQDIVKSPEGFVVRDESNGDALDKLVADGDAYKTNIQSGKGGLDVEERVFLSGKGYENLRSVFGPDMGVKK